MRMNLTVSDWLALLTHFMSLSLLAIGGAFATVPDMHRYLVDQQHWLSDSQFIASIALAQAAPGPNVLFIALLDWNVELNAAAGIGAGSMAWAYGLLGVTLTMLGGIMLPSTTPTYVAARWGHRNRERRAVRAIKQAITPIMIALLIATGWILATNRGSLAPHWPLWLVTTISTLLV
ncbi:MAG: chromate transporter [Rhodoferax sp.]|jgi:chromate transporter